MRFLWALKDVVPTLYAGTFHVYIRIYIYIHCKYRFIYTYIYWYFCFYILILFIMLYNVHFWFKVCSDLFLFKVKRLIFSGLPAKRWYVSTLPDTSSESPLERKGWRIRCDGAPRDPKQDSGFRRLKHPEKWRLFFWSRIWRQRGGCGLVFGKNGIMSHEEQNPKKRSIYMISFNGREFLLQKSCIDCIDFCWGLKLKMIC